MLRMGAAYRGDWAWIGHWAWIGLGTLKLGNLGTWDFLILTAVDTKERLNPKPPPKSNFDKKHIEQSLPSFLRHYLTCLYITLPLYSSYSLQLLYLSYGYSQFIITGPYLSCGLTYIYIYQLCSCVCIKWVKNVWTSRYYRYRYILSYTILYIKAATIRWWNAVGRLYRVGR